MLPTHHALAGAIIALPLARNGRRQAAVRFLAASVLIDADHYLGYVWRTHDFSLWRAYRHHRGYYRRPRRWRLRLRWPPMGIEAHRFLHAAPVLALALVTSLRWRPLLPIALGLLYHRFWDELWGWLE